MSKEDLKKHKIILRQIKEIPKNAQLLFYRNPNEFCNLQYEKINPEHIGIVRGLRKRKLRKKYSDNWIKVCKVKITGLFYIVHKEVQNIIYPYLNLIYTKFYNVTPLETLICFYYIVFALLIMCILVKIPMIEIVLSRS